MINQQILEGNWNEVKGKIRKRWGQLTNDDLGQFNGNVDQLVGLIQRKTGEARDSVESFLDDLTAGGSSAAGRATEAAREYSQRAAEGVRQGAKQTADTVWQGYEATERMIRRKGPESALFCLGAGVATGFMLAFLLRRK